MGCLGLTVVLSHPHPQFKKVIKKAANTGSNGMTTSDLDDIQQEAVAIMNEVRIGA